jgi:hypothetical protein
LQTVKKLPLKSYLSRIGLAKVNWLLFESSKERTMGLLLLLAPFCAGSIGKV